MGSQQRPKLRFLHSDDTLNRVKIDAFRRVPTDAIKFALHPGQPGSLKVRTDGTVLDGHHRLSDLLERGENIDHLPREITRIMSSDLFWIVGRWRGRLAIAARPRGGDWLEDEISGWRRDGIDVVVSLLESDEADQLDLLDESKIAEANGIHFISFPIPDRSVPASTLASLLLMANVSSALNEGKNVVVHCRQGVGRSGLIAAGILATAGFDPEQAINIVSAARGLAIPETPEQRLWVQQLPSKCRLCLPESYH